jgi:hypothetical protein
MDAGPVCGQPHFVLGAKCSATGEAPASFDEAQDALSLSTGGATRGASPAATR